MKKDYRKPYAKKVAFSYEDHVTAQSGYFGGGIQNREDTQMCQFWGPCNFYWDVEIKSRISTFDLKNCTTDQFPT